MDLKNRFCFLTKYGFMQGSILLCLTMALSLPSAYANVLHDAAMGGTVEQVKEFLAQTGDIDARYKNGGLTPLMIAAAKNPDPAVTKFLIDQKANLSARDANGFTALHHSVVSKTMNDEIVKMLIVAGSGINDKNNFGFTPIMYYVQNPKATLETTQFFIDYGANIKENENNGYSPFLCALQNKGENAIQIVKLLLDLGAKDTPEFKNNKCLHFVARGGNTELMKFMLSNIPEHERKSVINSLDQFNRTPFHWAVLNPDNEDMINMLLELGAEINSTVRTIKTEDAITRIITESPIYSAVMQPRPPINILKFLISKGAKMSVEEFNSFSNQYARQDTLYWMLNDIVKR